MGGTLYIYLQFTIKKSTIRPHGIPMEGKPLSEAQSTNARDAAPKAPRRWELGHFCSILSIILV